MKWSIRWGNVKRRTRRRLRDISWPLRCWIYDRIDPFEPHLRHAHQTLTTIKASVRNAFTPKPPPKPQAPTPIPYPDFRTWPKSIYMDEDEAYYDTPPVYTFEHLPKIKPKQSVLDRWERESRACPAEAPTERRGKDSGVPQASKTQSLNPDLSPSTGVQDVDSETRVESRSVQLVREDAENPQVSKTQSSNPGGWWMHMILGERNKPKTGAGLKVLKEWIESGQNTSIAIIARTKKEARTALVESFYGLLAQYPEGSTMAPKYIKSRGILDFPNGTRVQIFGAREPDNITGYVFEKAWIDEVAEISNIQKLMDALVFGVRLGERPQILLTSSFRRIPFIRNFRRKAARDPDQFKVTQTADILDPRKKRIPQAQTESPTPHSSRPRTSSRARWGKRLLSLAKLVTLTYKDEVIKNIYNITSRLTPFIQLCGIIIV